MLTLLIVIIAALVAGILTRMYHAKQEQAYFEQIQRYEEMWQAQIMKNARKKYLHA